MQDQEHTHVVYVYAPSFDKKMGGATSKYAITTVKKFWTFMQTTTRQAWLSNWVLATIAYRAVQGLAES